VFTKVKTPKEVFSEFVASWDNIKPDYKVSFEEFVDYFSVDVRFYSGHFSHYS